MEKAPLHPWEQVAVAKRLCSRHLFMCFRLQDRGVWQLLLAGFMKPCYP